MMMKDFASPQLVATDDQTHMIFSLSDAGINGWTTSSCVHEEEAVDGIIGLDPGVFALKQSPPVPGLYAILRANVVGLCTDHAHSLDMAPPGPIMPKPGAQTLAPRLLLRNHRAPTRKIEGLTAAADVEARMLTILKQGCRSGHGVLGAFTELPSPADSVKVSPAIAA